MATRFIDPSSKLQRAIWWYLIMQGEATKDDTVIANASVRRELPIRTVEAISFDPTYPFRPEGECVVQISHHFQAAIQEPTADEIAADPLIETKREYQQNEAFDAFVGSTLTALNVGEGQTLIALADALTAAGRDLAVPDGTDEGDLIAAANPDMADFRVDWVKFESPMIQRVKPEKDGTYWVKIVRLCAFVSYASI